MADKDFEISRRKALAGIGVVGVVSAGAGLGTTAYFSNGEAYEDNTITAGEFGLSNAKRSYVDQDGIGPDESNFDSRGNTVFAGGVINIGGAKPGDEYEFCWDITVKNNPGYIKIGVPRYDDEVGDVDDLFDTDELSTLGQETIARLVLKVDGESYEVTEETLEELPENLGDDEYALPSFVGNDGVGTLRVGSDWWWPDPDPTKYCHHFMDGRDHSKRVTVCLEIEIPSGVGNEIQDATVDWDFLVSAEQRRHNDLGTFADKDLPEVLS